MSAMGSELGCRSLAASLGTAGECISKPERHERTREGLSLPTCFTSGYNSSARVVRRQESHFEKGAESMSVC